jgi:hypothetical protein
VIEVVLARVLIEPPLHEGLIGKHGQIKPCRARHAQEQAVDVFPCGVVEEGHLEVLSVRLEVTLPLAEPHQQLERLVDQRAVRRVNGPCAPFTASVHDIHDPIKGSGKLDQAPIKATS